MFGLADINNFYVSCERLFRPDLKTHPVVVLTNNDGCIISRSQEAKQLGIKMGTPLFKVRNLIEQYQVKVFSSNYAFYADISSRVMSTLESMAPHVEVYSIDEAFLDIQGMSDLEAFGQHVRHTVFHTVGMPICVGIGPTKTLAKLANYGAKQYPGAKGVVDLSQSKRQRKLMSLVDVQDVWGIGSKLSHRMKALGIHTALDFADAPSSLIRKQGTVMLARTQAELNGDVCNDLEPEAPTKQQIVCSRSFSQRVTELKYLKEAVCEYTSKAGEKLRLEKRYAHRVTVSIRTNAFAKATPYYSNSAAVKLLCATDDTRDLIESALELVECLWKPGFAYAKAGVILSDFSDPGMVQLDLFNHGRERPKSKSLMATLDKINRSGKGKVFFAGQGFQKHWSMKRQFLSPCYTTRWKDIPVVR